MHYVDAVRHLMRLRSGSTTCVEFVSPIVSVCLAAERNAQKAANTSFSSDCQDYAAYVGLPDALAGRDPQHVRGALHGRTYSPLESLYLRDHINRCNTSVGRVIQQRLTREQFNCVGRELVAVVGELHDNVISHAHGKGYSAAQVYNRNHVEYAVADAGRGFLRSVQRVVEISSDREAIEWAFTRGNTSWRDNSHTDLSSQRGMGEAELTAALEPGLCHAGVGLATLLELVQTAGGRLWVASGAASMEYSSGAWTSTHELGFSWDGVAIELEIPLARRPQRPVNVPEQPSVDDLF